MTCKGAGQRPRLEEHAVQLARHEHLVVVERIHVVANALPVHLPRVSDGSAHMRMHDQRVELLHHKHKRVELSLCACEHVCAESQPCLIVLEMHKEQAVDESPSRSLVGHAAAADASPA